MKILNMLVSVLSICLFACLALFSIRSWLLRGVYGTSKSRKRTPISRDRSLWQELTLSFIPWEHSLRTAALRVFYYLYILLSAACVTGYLLSQDGGRDAYFVLFAWILCTGAALTGNAISGKRLRKGR